MPPSRAPLRNLQIRRTLSRLFLLSGLGNLERRWRLALLLRGCALLAWIRMLLKLKRSSMGGRRCLSLGLIP